jgi:prolyl-tRNA editing enzyme YbaK/EbsC (Cys-tRNA(Pro) deacylase)
VERRIRAEIDALGVVCERMECDPALADTAAFCAHYGVELCDSANLILVASKKKPRQYAACLLLADSRLDVNRAVCQLMGVKRASFASADETRELTGQLIGGVSAFGLPEGMPLYIDARVMTRERIVVGGGSRSSKLLLVPSELHKLPGARVVDGLAQVIEAPAGQAP